MAGPFGVPVVESPVVGGEVLDCIVLAVVIPVEALDPVVAEVEELALSPDDPVLLSLVAFRMPASYDSLEALCVGEGKACAGTEDLDHALTGLEDRGLIGWDREANRYDAHPIVRGFVWQQANPQQKQALLQSIVARFESMATPAWQEVESRRSH